jgi:hypothetical protein
VCIPRDGGAIFAFSHNGEVVVPVAREFAGCVNWMDSSGARAPCAQSLPLLRNHAMPRICASLILLPFVFLHVATVAAQTDSKAGTLLGRWDLTVKGPGGDYPSWIEISKSGHSTLVGGYVGQFGSVRPISKIEIVDGGFRFTVPPQWERRKTDVEVTGRLEGEALRGELTDDQGKKLVWEAQRAPALDDEHDVVWGAPIDLLKDTKLGGWKSRAADGKHGWQLIDGVLANEKPGQDIISEQKFTDFRLVAEFRYPKGSNSGIYLRGRYEFQIEDNFGQAPESHKAGGIYGFLTPSFNAIKPAGEWQSVEITLIGRRVTAVLNEKRILDQQLIPGITGGALDSNEGEPGPIMIQGDHGPVEFRKLVVTPAKE